jgi:hypothetical protein
MDPELRHWFHRGHPIAFGGNIRREIPAVLLKNLRRRKIRDPDQTASAQGHIAMKAVELEDIEARVTALEQAAAGTGRR